MINDDNKTIYRIKYNIFDEILVIWIIGLNVDGTELSVSKWSSVNPILNCFSNRLPSESILEYLNSVGINNPKIVK